MQESLPLILEDAQGQRRETHSARIAIRLENRELWIEADGNGGVVICADSSDQEDMLPVLVMRPQAINALSLTVELEPAGEEDEDHDHGHHHEHGDDCGCGHSH